MSFSFGIDPERSVVMFKGYGVFTSQDLFECLKEVISHPLYQKHFNHLVDLTEVEQHHAGPIEVRIRAGADLRMADKVGAVKFAIVSATEEVFSMTQKYKEAMSGGPIEVETFMDMDEAKAWLGIDR